MACKRGSPVQPAAHELLVISIIWTEERYLLFVLGSTFDAFSRMSGFASRDDRDIPRSSSAKVPRVSYE